MITNKSNSDRSLNWILIPVLLLLIKVQTALDAILVLAVDVHLALDLVFVCVDELVGVLAQHVQDLTVRALLHGRLALLQPLDPVIECALGPARLPLAQHLLLGVEF